MGTARFRLMQVCRVFNWWPRSETNIWPFNCKIWVYVVKYVPLCYKFVRILYCVSWLCTNFCTNADLNLFDHTGSCYFNNKSLNGLLKNASILNERTFGQQLSDNIVENKFDLMWHHLNIHFHFTALPLQCRLSTYNKIEIRKKNSFSLEKFNFQILVTST